MTSSRPLWAALILSTIASAVIGFVPLFGGPGYEAALAAGLILPSIAAAATAVDVSVLRPIPISAVGRGAIMGALVTASGLAVTYLHGLRVGLCDPAEGAAFYLLGPGAGAVLGGIWGAVAGTLTTLSGRARPVLAALLAVAGPMLGIAVSLYRFYTSPMVFAFDPFAGFFAGTLYDTVITGLDRLQTYRVGTAATILAVVTVALHLYRDGEGHVRARGRGAALAFLGAAAAAFCMLHAFMGTSLGHYQTTESIRHELGHAAIAKRCDVLYPSGVLKRDAHMLARECDAHVAQLEKYFDTKAPERITVFVFASAEQKGELMGAARTFIAKPWREEIYIQGAGFPHRVLRHELAHVVAGSFARGPFRVAGPLGGLVPDPGRIEGLAVAAAPRQEELTLEEWAKAMKDLKLLPELERVFKLTFLGEPSSRAYTVAGSFIEWFRKTYGVDALKAWYGGARLSEVADGKSITALERDWLAALDKVRVSPEAMAVARARFDRPAIFGRRCPHIVDRLLMEAGWALGRLDTEAARERYDDVLELDPDHLDARLGLAACALRDGKVDEAKAIYDKIEDDPDLPEALRTRGVEARGDVELMTGDAAAAKKRYDEVARLVVDQDHERALDVKRYAAQHEAARAAIVDYLLGDERFGRDIASGAAELGAWSEREPKLGLADYLLSRSYLARGRWELAARHLDKALDRELPIPSVAREALESRMILACAFGDSDGAQRLFERWRKDKKISSAARDELGGFIERCTLQNAEPRSKAK